MQGDFMIKEITINFDNLERIERVLIDNRVGKNPLLLIPDDKLFDKHKVFDIISIIEWTLGNLNINPRFPFPVYFLYPKNIVTQQIPIIHHRNDIPRHFDRYVGKGNDRVDSLRQKIKIHRKILSSYSFDQMWSKLKTQKEAQKKLFNLLTEVEQMNELIKKMGR
jgi:hypothetical protein